MTTLYVKELEELEGRSAKKNEFERAEKAKNKDFEEIRGRYEEELAQLKLVWDSLRTMKPKQLVDDERVWRELVDRYHDYFAGRHGRRGRQGPRVASRPRRGRGRAQGDHRHREGSAQGEVDQAAEGRVGVQPPRRRRPRRSTRRWA